MSRKNREAIKAANMLLKANRDGKAERIGSLSAPAGSELDRYNAEIEKRALEAADLHLEGAQDRTRGGTKLLPIRQAIYARIKEVDHILSQNTD